MLHVDLVGTKESGFGRKRDLKVYELIQKLSFLKNKKINKVFKKTKSLSSIDKTPKLYIGGKQKDLIVAILFHYMI